MLVRRAGAWRVAVAGVALSLVVRVAPAHAEAPFDASAALDLQATGGVSRETQLSADDDLGAQHEAPEDVAAEPTAEPTTPDAAASSAALPVSDQERMHSTWLGSSGGLHVADAGTGERGSMRLQLALDFFVSQDYLRYGDEHHASSGKLSLSYTVLEYLELFTSIATHSNFNSFGRTELLQVVGDMLFGAKGAFLPLPWLSLGGEFRLFVPSGVGEVGVGFDGTSVGLRGNVTADLRKVGRGVALIGRFTLGYYFDQSANLIDDVESARFSALDNPLPRADEDRQLVTRQERLAFGINRMDHVDLELGLEVPIHVVDDFYVHPLLEWRFGVPVNRQGYDCLNVQTSADSRSPDGCLEQKGVAAMPMTMSLGARLYPWLSGLSVTLGLDVGLTGAHTFVRELAPNRPWAFLLGFGYAHVPGRVPVPAAAPAPAPLPVEPRRVRLDGVVMEVGSETPIADARIEYVGPTLTAQVTGPDGHFVSYPFEAGEVRMQVSHPDRGSAECLAVIDAETMPTGDDPRVAVRCELPARPQLGALDGSVRSLAGTPLASVTIRLTGPRSAELTSDASGHFTATELPPGAYEMEASAAGHQTRKRALLVPGGQTVFPELVLEPALPPPGDSSVRVTKRALVIKRQVHFRKKSAELEPDGFTLLDEIAATLNQNPQLLRVEVQGHTDNRGMPALNRQLSQARAESVREYLVRAGVSADRLSARGYGDSRPLVPNLTDENRARNRRVEFIILERGSE